MSPIAEYLPHRGPALWLDRLVEVDAEHAIVESDVPADGRLVCGGRMPVWAGIELMAQTVAVWAGARARSEGHPPRVGFLLGARRYNAHCDGFASGDTLTIEAWREFAADSGLGMFKCSVRRGTVPLAEAQIAVFEPVDARPYLEGSDVG